MQITQMQSVAIILAVALGSLTTRLIPFLFFPNGKKPPAFVQYLGSMLPPAMMALLVVYCFRNTVVLSYPYGAPEIIALGVIILLHKWKNSVLLSIGGGTVVYMLLVQMVFV